LLDTHILIWAVSDPARLDQATHEAIVDPDNQVMVSSATVWEIAIKQAQGRLNFPMDRFDPTMHAMGFDVLPILPVHAMAAGALPRHHADPFDRMLIAQARVENLVLATRDNAIARYDVPLLGPATARRPF
jgi:PIN domain nuclease of toxin-antitoxin system